LIAAMTHFGKSSLAIEPFPWSAHPRDTEPKSDASGASFHNVTRTR
jgi:hypothetical protein